jgi:hypothetical protein
VRRGLCVLCVLCGSIFVACGRKGPPLAPIVYVPRPVSELSAKRVEDEVVLQFKIPAANTDSSSPADLDRIEVYAHTGPLPAPADFWKYGTLVHRIEVKQPPASSERDGETADGPAAAEETGAPATPKQSADAAAKAGGLVEQGWAVSVREKLTEKHLETGPMPPVRAAPPPATAIQVDTLETPGTVNFPLPVSRYYTIVGISQSRNRKGPHAGPIRVPLVSPLQPPGEVKTTYTADAISLSWPRQAEDAEPPPAAPAKTPVTEAVTLASGIQETPETYEIYADIETPGTEDAPRAGAPPALRTAPPPTPRFGYNVYEVPSSPAASDAAASADAAAASVDPDTPRAPVLPLNAALLTATAFNDPRVGFGTERCYVVRRVEMIGGVAIESAPSSPACVTPADKFAPSAPKSLVSVATTTSVNLIWDANTETDLAGYLVLRVEAPDDKLTPLTPAPITDAAYIDGSIRRSRSYIYEVVAIDKAGNQSEPSNRVEETIR